MTAVPETSALCSPPAALFRPEPEISDPLFELYQGIGHAVSWRELEAWLNRTRAAYEQGMLAAAHAEQLTRQVIRVSRRVPEG